ncbi:retrovirus-related pol polyprotein from transposon TNT 1-94 [Tanacetum coccineum]
MDRLNQHRIRSREQCDTLINQVNQKSVEISDLNASRQEKVLVITSLKDDLRKLKGKALVDNAVTKHTINPEMLKIDVEPITPKLLNKKDRVVTKAVNLCLPSVSTILLEKLVAVVDPQRNKDTKRKVWKPTGKVFTNIGYIWRPTGRTFTIVGNVCPLTRINTTTEVPRRKPPALENETPKPVVTLVYSRKPRKSKTNVPISKSKVPKSVSANKKEPTRHGLIRGLPKLKFEKDHLCSACAMGKCKKKSHKPKSEDTNQEKLYLLHMDLYGPMRVASINGKKSILVIVDDYSRFTWVKFLRLKDEAPDFIIKFLKMIQVRLKVIVRRIRTYNGTEFVNQTLRKYYKKIDISHETSVAHSLQQNGVIKRRNRTLIEAARTMLIYAKSLLFL